MLMAKGRSRIIDEVQEIFTELKNSGMITKKQVAEIEALKNLKVKAIEPKLIRRIRARENLSQAVLAMVLNTSTSAIQKWETGEKKPSGPSLKLLSLLRDKGLAALI